MASACSSSSRVLSSHSRTLVLCAGKSSSHHALRSQLMSPNCVGTQFQPVRRYAQVGATTYLGDPPSPPTPPGLTPRTRANGPTSTSAASPQSASPPVRPFDAQVLAELRKAVSQPSGSTQPKPTPLTTLAEEYMKRAGNVLEASLPYESRPSAERRARFEKEVSGDSTADGALVVVAHAVHDRTGHHKVTYSTGFVLNAPGSAEGESVLVTCAHTLEEIRHDPLLRAAHPSPAVSHDQLLSGSFVISGSSSAPKFHPVSSVLSAMHRGDVLLLSAPSPNTGALRSLPVNPYPVHPGTHIRAQFVTDKVPETGPHRDGWTPWLGGTWRKWIKGTVVGYRDYAGREAQPGTYDSLAHLHFEPPPTAGSSGGPIIDEESGSVIGIVLGTQLVNQVEGVRGWGVPAEMIFEMFSLPGLKLKSRS